MRMYYLSSLLLGLFLSLPALAAQDASESAGDLRSRVLQAYRQIQKVESQGQITSVQVEEGQEKAREVHPIKFAMDRAGNQLAFEGLDVQLVVTQGQLNLRLVNMPGGYVKQPGHDALDYSRLMQAAPFLAALPDFALYFSDDAIPADARQLPADEMGRPGLVFLTRGTQMTYRIEPKTSLVDQVEYEVPMRNGGKARIQWTTQTKTGDQINSSVFQFNAGDDDVHGDIQALVRGMQDSSKLQGKTAPAFELKDLSGSDVSLKDLQSRHRIVILDFWATWCGPCRITLPVLQRVSNWVASDKIDAAIYTVNIQETPQQVKQMWSQLNLSLPVLMDSEGKVGHVYRAFAIPMLVMIVDGKIQHIHRGAVPTLEEDLKAQIQTILSSKPAGQ